MSLICNNNNTNNNPTLQARVVQDTNRDLGLSNVFNLNTDLNPCVEAFTSPSYTIDGACCNVTTGTTFSACTYNVNELDDITLVFNLTGSTQYTGYTGEFCYNLTSGIGFLGNYCTNYSDISGATISNTINTSIIDQKFGGDWTIKTWNRFSPNNCNTNITVDTSIYPFLKSKECYIITLTNPPKPTLTSESVDLFGNMTFVNKTFENIINGQTFLDISEKPVNGVAVVSLNGVTLAYSTDYTINDTIITFSEGLESTDVVHVFYNRYAIGSNEGFLETTSFNNLEMFSVTGITSGVTSSTTNIVNWNTTNNRLEIFTKDDMNPTVDPIVSINGVILAHNVDVFRSNIVNNKINLNSNVILEIGDIISIYYRPSSVQNLGDMGVILTDTPTISWDINSNLSRINNSGIFYIELAEKTDTTYSNILNSGSTIYIPDTLAYNYDLGPITTTNINDYIYRVRFVKSYYSNVSKSRHETESVSNNGSFTIKWGYVNNTNF